MFKEPVFVFFICFLFSQLSAQELDIKNGKSQIGKYQISASLCEHSTRVYVLDTENGTVWVTKPYNYIIARGNINDYQPWEKLPPLPIEK